MLNVGTPELLVILLVALIVLGPDKLPDAARQIGRAVSQVRRMGSGFQAELRDAFHEVEAEGTTPRPPVTRNGAAPKTGADRPAPDSDAEQPGSPSS